MLDNKPSLGAVNAIHCGVEQGSHKAQPPAVVAALPSTTMTGAQTLAAIAQQHPVVAATNLPTEVANAFGELLRAVNDDIRIIEASPFQTTTAPQSPKIGILHEVHPCGGLVIDFPGKEPILSDDNDEE
uniref:Uncharacterized protein n=1 Tax=Romanomermis culicivorax TaxID=13658 RepID=A0A915KVJ3_ROMCU